MKLTAEEIRFNAAQFRAMSAPDADLSEIDPVELRRQLRDNGIDADDQDIDTMIDQIRG